MEYEYSIQWELIGGQREWLVRRRPLIKRRAEDWKWAIVNRINSFDKAARLVHDLKQPVQRQSHEASE